MAVQTARCIDPGTNQCLAGKFNYTEKSIKYGNTPVGEVMELHLNHSLSRDAKSPLCRSLLSDMTHGLLLRCNESTVMLDITMGNEIEEQISKSVHRIHFQEKFNFVQLYNLGNCVQLNNFENLTNLTSWLGYMRCEFCFPIL